VNALTANDTEYHAAGNYLPVSMPSLAMRDEYPGSTSNYWNVNMNVAMQTTVDWSCFVKENCPMRYGICLYVYWCKGTKGGSCYYKGILSSIQELKCCI